MIFNHGNFGSRMTSPLQPVVWYVNMTPFFLHNILLLALRVDY